ncbi:hypothetical protein V5799_033816, partial [Amblyomma americanum]
TCVNAVRFIEVLSRSLDVVLFPHRGNALFLTYTHLRRTDSSGVAVVLQPSNKHHALRSYRPRDIADQRTIAGPASGPSWRL